MGYRVRQPCQYNRLSLRTRVAIAVGAVVCCALALVAAVVYPAVGANLRAHDDESLVRVANETPAIAAKLKRARTPLGQLLPFGNTQLQIIPGAVVGLTNGFIGITDHDVQVAAGRDRPYFHDEAYGGSRPPATSARLSRRMAGTRSAGSGRRSRR